QTLADCQQAQAARVKQHRTDERLFAQWCKGSFFQVADLNDQLVEGLPLDLISESSEAKQSQIVEGRGTQLLRGAAEINGAAQGPCGVERIDNKQARRPRPIIENVPARDDQQREHD